MKPAFSAILPAAGLSTRMGRQKALLPYGSGYNFAQHLSSGFSGFGCNPVVMVVNEDFDPAAIAPGELIFVVNRHLELGRSHSIHLGLKHVPDRVSCFIHNIDNPFPGLSLLAMLCEAVKDYGYAVPVYQGRGGHPILLGKNVTEDLRSRHDLGDFRQALEAFERIEVPCSDARILMNINTPEEYQRFLSSSGGTPDFTGT